MTASASAAAAPPPSGFPSREGPNGPGGPGERLAHSLLLQGSTSGRAGRGGVLISAEQNL